MGLVFISQFPTASKQREWRLEPGSHRADRRSGWIFQIKNGWFFYRNQKSYYYSCREKEEVVGGAAVVACLHLCRELPAEDVRSFSDLVWFAPKQFQRLLQMVMPTVQRRTTHFTDARTHSETPNDHISLHGNS